MNQLLTSSGTLKHSSGMGDVIVDQLSDGSSHVDVALLNDMDFYEHANILLTANGGVFTLQSAGGYNIHGRYVENTTVGEWNYNQSQGGTWGNIANSLTGNQVVRMSLYRTGNIRHQGPIFANVGGWTMHGWAVIDGGNISFGQRNSNINVRYFVECFGRRI